MELTKLQKKHLKSIQWLLGTNNGSGRTYLLAYVTIENALKRPNIPIHFCDHVHTTYGTTDILWNMHKIARELELKNIFLEIDNFRMAVTYRGDKDGNV